ncbi:MAG TPA: hypothetical protein VFM11_14530, partial [Burkholderiales bacterium]|nr:hypothetical protein [Burkholderiales bacterium]
SGDNAGTEDTSHAVISMTIEAVIRLNRVAIFYCGRSASTCGKMPQDAMRDTEADRCRRHYNRCMTGFVGS